jgi:heme/copper-type cytochrome/quinol oxidase subunit 3
MSTSSLAFLWNQSVPTYLLVAWGASLVLGIILASSVKTTDTDREKGDKRISAVFFIMLSFIIFASLFISYKCKEGVNNTVELFKKTY